jgi:hypothetical protein
MSSKVSAMSAFSVAAVAGVAMLFAGAAQAGDRVQVPRSIGFAADSGASDKVKDECALQTKVTHFLDEFSDQVELVDGKPSAKGRSLSLAIKSVLAPGGGAWSGSKSMVVVGSLHKDGKRVASFTATRYSGGGMFAGYKGTCSIIGRCAKTIGKDIAGWLKNPKDGARLGDS